MSELLRELEEDLQSERLQKLWHSFGKAIIGLSIGIVFLTAAVVVWQNIEQRQRAEMTSQLIKGADRLKVEDYQGAIDTFDTLAGKDNTYAAMAALRKAQAQAALGANEEAEKTYAQAAKDAVGGNGSAFGDLARLLVAYAQAALSSPGDSPFIHSFTEQTAWRLLKEGKKEEAAQAFSSLRDNRDAPKSMRQRAAVMLDYLAPVSHEK